MKKIGLYGIAGVYNLGCEAIVRGTYLSNKNVSKLVEWVYFSPNAEEDKKKIGDLPIKVIQTKRRYVFLKKVINKVLDMLKIDLQIPYDDYKDILKQCDTIVSIGGDIYTIPNYLRNKKKYPYYNRMIEFGELAMKMNKKVIIYGASIGPFGEYNKAKLYFKNHLEKVDGIFAREYGTIKYLEKIGIYENVYFLPDPAFELRGRSSVKSEEIKENLIGLNLSGLSILETYGEVTIDSIKRLTNVVADIIDSTNSDLLLIPHVFAKYEVDNDFIILRRIMDNMPEKYKNRIAISKANTFLSVKKELLSCSMVIAARMHCAINAMSEGIPTILLSYSSKAKGMCKFAYDSTDWAYNIKNIEDKEFIELINNMLSNRNKISNNLINNLNKKFDRNKYLESYNKMKNIILDNRGIK